MKALKTVTLCVIFYTNIMYAEPLWMRYPAISPDGAKIAFSYKGDIYTVPVSGGQAQQLTMHLAHDYMPVWSPDSKTIAFASNRFGNFDIYIAPAVGGNAVRLTTFSGAESPYTFTPDGKHLVFGAKIQATASSAAFPSAVIVGEANYSNAHGSPWVYRHTDIGKLVGMPIPGTMTSVSWETLQDPTLVFGIPVVGYKLADGSYLENQQLEPDYKIANSPDKLVNSEDEQLKKAVEILLEEIN